MTELEHYSPPRTRAHMRRRRPVPRVSVPACGSAYAAIGYVEPLTIRYAAEAVDVDRSAEPSLLIQVLMFGTKLGRFVHVAWRMLLPVAVTWMWLQMHRHHKVAA